VGRYPTSVFHGDAIDTQADDRPHQQQWDRCVHLAPEPGRASGGNPPGIAVDAKAAQGGIFTSGSTPAAGFSGIGATRAGLAIGNDNEIVFAARPAGASSDSSRTPASAYQYRRRGTTPWCYARVTLRGR